MKTRIPWFTAGVVAGIFLVDSGPSWSATSDRLFPDLVLRYAVGDTNAQNPIHWTEGPKTLAAGDLNGDGRADVIAGNLDGSISVLLSKPQGGLQDQILHPATGLLQSNNLRAVVTADFNNDQRLDVAVADIARGGVVVLLGNGDGTLTPFQRTDFGPARALAAGDFNRDGRSDLLVACSPQNCDEGTMDYTNGTPDRFLCILPGNGDGTFGAAQFLLNSGAKACFYDVAAADVNQDGHLDALALDFSEWRLGTNQWTWHKRILIFTNDGTGGFIADQPATVVTTAGEGPRAFTLAYIDELLLGGTNPPPGATLDLVVANRDSATLDIFVNHGGLNFGEFGTPMSIAVGDSPRDMAAADLDGDGWTDLVVVDRDEDVISVLPGEGGGIFSPASFILPTGVSPRQVVLADLNGDGAMDAAVNNRVSEDISIFIGQYGLIGFLLPVSYYPAGFTPVSVVAEDFDHDGYPDLATANMRSHDVRVRMNLGDGTFGLETIYAVNNQPAILAAGDLNRDGHQDLVVSCLGSGYVGSLVTLLGRGDGTFQSPVAAFPHTNIVTFRPYWLRVGDLSGDGVLDVVVGCVNGAMVVFRGIGDGSFESGLLSCLTGEGRPLGLALGDFNRDNQLDIATSRGKTFLNNGHLFDATNGTNIATIPYTPFNAGWQAWAVEAEDLDMDGNLDLMVALTFQRPDPIGVLFGNGDGSFTEPTIYAGPDVGVVAISGTDMDGDGVKDIVIGNRCAATVIIFRGLGNRLFEQKEVIRTYSVEDIAVADLNKDGKPDIVGVGLGLWPLLNGSAMTFTVPRAEQIGSQPERIGLYINELMALNQDFLIVNGTTPDWIEIYNHNFITQSLDGWSLVQFTGDGDTNRWFFPPSNSIPPWGHLVVYCKNKAPTNTTLYANFELSSEGETILLLGASGGEVDRVRYPALPSDVSYARFLDGARFFSFNPAPTMGSRNARPANLQPKAERKDPYFGAGGTSVGLTGRFFDDVAIAYAGVCYRVADSGNAFAELALNDDGAHGDKLAGDGYYGVILPPQPPGATIEYYLRAVDLEGQVDNSPDGPEDPATVLHQVAAPLGNPTLRMVELVADNKTGLLDERGQFEDWIELMNTGTTPASLDGLVLTKDYFSQSSAWHFPSNRWVNPGERIVVFCDDDQRQGPLHTDFKLLRDGDRVYLIRAADWVLIDSLSFNALPTDVSFGVLGSSTEPQMMAWPTPSAENLALIPRQSPPGPAPEIYYRLQPWGGTGTNRVALRWTGSTTTLYGVEVSTNLTEWTESIVPPTHLGQGFYQWLEPDPTAPKRFYRVVRDTD